MRASDQDFLLKIHIPNGSTEVLDPSRVEAALVWLAALSRMSPGFLVQAPVRTRDDILLGAAVAAAAGLVLTLGTRIDVHLGITAAGHEIYPLLVLAAAGATTVLFYACQLGVPARALPTTALLGGLAVLITQVGPESADDVDRLTRILVAALVIGLTGQVLARRLAEPATLWLVPALLPLLPAPATLLPLLAESEAARQALQGQALATAFCIGVGVAVGSIAVESYQRYRTHQRSRRPTHDHDQHQPSPSRPP